MSKNLITKLLFVFFASFFLLQSYGQTILYVAPNGSGNKFTKYKPGSLKDAQLKVRTLNSGMKEDIIVSLLEGTYTLNSSIKLGNEDSGKNGHRIIYQANKSGTVSLTGGKEIKGWIKAKNGMFKTTWNGPGFRQLYVNGERAIRARTPNKNNEQTYGPYYRTISWNADKKYISIHSGDIENWDGLCDVEMVIKKHWGQNRMRIDRFEVQGDETKLFFREPESSIDAWTKGCCPGFDDKQTYYFENSIDLLDVAGEWFLDREQNELYYLPKPGENMYTAEVIVPVQETLLEIDGASYISFEGLIFEHANWDMPDSARVGIQAGWRKDYSRTFIPGGIQVVRAHHLCFSKNIIRHFGGAGIEYLHSTHDNLIEGNLITGISGNGIQININSENRTPSTEEECRNETIRNNYVIKTACEFTGNVGIMATYVNNMLIENNEVTDMPYSGISIGWGWTDSITGLHDNIIRYNKIHHTGQLHDDGAGIYSLSKSEGSVFSENYLYEIRKSEWAGDYTFGGIYLDNGSASILIENNVVQNVDVYPMVAWNPPNHSNTFRNNFYTNIGKLKIREGNILKNNVAIDYDEWSPKAREIMKNAGPKVPAPSEIND